ncbi:unnamed protein product [Effrenium voratum]|nr:unnamed protein product [Effrenium voratum]
MSAEADVSPPSLTNSRNEVSSGYRKVGFLLDDDEDAALIADAQIHDCLIVGASTGFTQLTGFTRDEVLGQNCRMMLEGVPEVAISKSARKNLRDFCRMCKVKRLDHISEVASLQPNSRRDGSQFVNFFLVGLVQVLSGKYLLGVQRCVGEGLFASLNGKMLEEVTESARTSFKRIRAKMMGLEPTPGQSSTCLTPGFTFYSERLQDHCLLLNGGRTAMRREPQELATNCLVFGNAPVRPTASGLYFAVRIEDAVTTFDGLPIMGFTRRKPTDVPELYPTVCRCLGASVLVGACGEAFARDKPEHFRIGFKPPPQTEVASWALQADVPPHKRRAPVSVLPGDVFGCSYTREGRMQLWRNGVLALDFNVQRPLQEDCDYYAVVDVCLAAYSVTLLPDMSPGQSQEPSVPKEVPVEPAPSTFKAKADVSSQKIPEDIDAIISDVVNQAIVKKAIQSAVSSCKFCVTIADPRGMDFPLIAVSEAFEKMTGFKRSEILGANCRFLNQGCPISPSDLIGLRLASESGCAFTALLPNRKKSGEMFINLLDLRGLAIATDVETSEELWYLIGIQADITGLSECLVPEDHVKELQEIANEIRKKMVKEISKLAAGGMEEQVDRQTTLSSNVSGPKSASSYKLLQEPLWRKGTLSKKAVLEMATKLDHQAKVRRVAPPHGPLWPVKGVGVSVLLLSVFSFLTGLLLGRGTRRF